MPLLGSRRSHTVGLTAPEPRRPHLQSWRRGGGVGCAVRHPRPRLSVSCCDDDSCDHHTSSGHCPGPRGWSRRPGPALMANDPASLVPVRTWAMYRASSSSALARSDRADLALGGSLDPFIRCAAIAGFRGEGPRSSTLLRHPRLRRGALRYCAHWAEAAWRPDQRWPRSPGSWRREARVEARRLGE